MENIYFTKDLWEAGYLYASEQKLIRLQKEGKFFWFIFLDKEISEKLALSYWNGEATVNPKAYSDAVRTLKDRLFAQK